MSNGGRVLVALYPPAFRDRWGRELTDEVERTGWRSWPRLLVAVAAMWLHPAIWPADSAIERRRRAAGLGVVVTAAGWLAAHAVLESSELRMRNGAFSPDLTTSPNSVPSMFTAPTHRGSVRHASRDEAPPNEWPTYATCRPTFPLNWPVLPSAVTWSATNRASAAHSSASRSPVDCASPLCPPRSGGLPAVVLPTA